MRVKKLNGATDTTHLLKKLNVDSGGVKILHQKSQIHLFYIEDLHVGAANILKQDALSIGADLAVPRGTVIAKTPTVDCLLIATTRQLQKLAKKELAQPFGLKGLAEELACFLDVKKPKKAKIMGVLNANEDSFYEGSRFVGKEAVRHIERMVDQGADIIDIGAVSSRPGAAVVDEQEELQRLKPIFQAICEAKIYEDTVLSIDSYAPLVVKEALESGFSIINDITGFENDTLCKLCASYNATAVVMHMQGTPQTMQNNPQYDDVVFEVYEYLAKQVEKLESFGVQDIVLDVGIGFGKRLEDNIALLKNLEHFLRLEKTLLVGASRKSMIDALSPSKPHERLAGTLALHLEAVRNGAGIVRVHDVYEHKQALEVAYSLM